MGTGYEITALVIPSEGGGFTRRCIASLARQAAESPLEVILVGRETSEVEALVPGLSPGLALRGWKPAAGLPAALNEASTSAGGDLLLLLDERTVLEPGALAALAKVLQGLPSTAACTPRVLEGDGRLIEGGFSFLEGGRIRGVGEGAPPGTLRHREPGSAPGLSVHCNLLRRSAWSRCGGLDGRIADVGLALIDLGMTLRAMGEEIRYEPAAVARRQRDVLGTVLRAPRPTPASIERLRPALSCPDRFEGEPGEEKRVLVLGIYLADRPNNAADTVSVLQESRRHRVDQRWVALGADPPGGLLEGVTVRTIRGKAAKFEILNALLAEIPLGTYDFVLLVDDDIILPHRFVDAFLRLQQTFDLALAQPARTPNSYIDHPIVMQHPGVLGRRTLFVEIGPVVSFARPAYPHLFPFDTLSPMGWGYSNVWARRFEQVGLKMGIVDAVPVDHSLRKPVANYGWQEADRQRKAYLMAHDHLPLDDCFRVIDVFPLEDPVPCRASR